jgi:hypothetical protein
MMHPISVLVKRRTNPWSSAVSGSRCSCAPGQWGGILSVKYHPQAAPRSATAGCGSQWQNCLRTLHEQPLWMAGPSTGAVVCSLDIRQVPPQERPGDADGVAPWAAIPVQAPASPYASVPLVSKPAERFGPARKQPLGTLADFQVKGITSPGPRARTLVAMAPLPAPARGSPASCGDRPAQDRGELQIHPNGHALRMAPVPCCLPAELPPANTLVPPY